MKGGYVILYERGWPQGRPRGNAADGGHKPAGRKQSDIILSAEVLRTERRKVLAETLTFHVGAVGGVREAAWIKEHRTCCSIF